MNIFSLIHLISLIFVLNIGIIVFIKNTDNKINQFFLYLCVYGSYWTFSEFGFAQSTTVESALFWAKFYSFWPILLSFLLHFILIYTENDRWLQKKRFLILIYLPSIILSFTYFFIQPYMPVMESWGWERINTVMLLSNISDLWTVCISLVILYFLFNYYLKINNKRKKNQAKNILIGFFLPLIINILSIIILVIYKITLPNFTTLGVIIGFGFIAYGIWKYELFRLSPTTEADNIISTMADALFLTDEKSIIYSMNSSAENISGWNKNELIGTNITSILSINPKVINSLDSLNYFETDLKTKQGSKIPLSVSSSILKDKNNQIYGYIYIGRDITEQRKIEANIRKKTKDLETINTDLNSKNEELISMNEELSATQEKLIISEKNFRLISESLPTGIFEIDKNGLLTYSNSYFNNFFSIDQNNKQHLSNIIKPDIEEPLVDICFKKLNKMEVFSDTFQIYNKSDESKWIQLNITPMASVRESRYIGTISDITQLKNAEMELQKINKELSETQLEKEDYIVQLQEQTVILQLYNKKLCETEKEIKKQNKKLKNLDELKSNFLNITSHELRTPMTSMKGYVQMFLRGLLGDITERQIGALNVIQRNINRLDALIQDILDISRLESGTLKFLPKRTYIPDLIKEIIETMSSSAEIKHIKIDLDIIGEIPYLHIDSDRIKQVVINLLNNAIKFSNEKSIIQIIVYAELKNVIIKVKDNGRGIPKKNQKDVFKTFYQVDSGMDRKFGGAGLGLSICQGIVIAHGGEITVESEGKGKGSTFQFTLPIVPITDIEDRFKKLDIFKLIKNK